jgi:hypothetical protein
VFFDVVQVESVAFILHAIDDGHSLFVSSAKTILSTPVARYLTSSLLLFQSTLTVTFSVCISKGPQKSQRYTVWGDTVCELRRKVLFPTINGGSD